MMAVLTRRMAGKLGGEEVIDGTSIYLVVGWTEDVGEDG